MPILTCSGASLSCSMGSAPSVLTTTPKIVGSGVGTTAGNVLDHLPMINIAPFGMCRSTANPAVAAASNAPMPCVPLTVAPWTPGSAKVMVGTASALTDNSTLACAWAGQITITAAAPGIDISS